MDSDCRVAVITVAIATRQAKAAKDHVINNLIVLYQKCLRAIPQKTSDLPPSYTQKPMKTNEQVLKCIRWDLGALDEIINIQWYQWHLAHRAQHKLTLALEQVARYFNQCTDSHKMNIIRAQDMCDELRFLIYGLGDEIVLATMEECKEQRVNYEAVERTLGIFKEESPPEYTA
ncbi:uncharacterized protein LY89DRAFT_669320 [Mollisia scopiformis]|uniref:Uncharacterized protein n=1 Tax=Mollisia scopiformis TaxID=149040 RepID=A0A194X9S0_MOLSC|nr:uncharacterized protein LY89DRAFT_669320 [Mollisia scopiformis]KUJ16874.1 hypothetical protein LY89DRAFT_669320 [Mollisia scopiformis]